MAERRALIVEDDADINEIVATKLSRSGFSCAQAFSGSEAKMLLEGAGRPLPFDVVITDLMLPGLMGENLVALIRELDPSAPIIVISAKGATTDKVDLLKLGADDYLTKPFDLDELMARIEVQLRHRTRAGSGHREEAPDEKPADGGSSDESDFLRYQTWTLDPAARAFTVDGSPIELTRLEFGILETLMSRPGRVFSKQELFERAWGMPYAVDDNTVNVHVSNIRSKLRGTETSDYIKTVWGMGFKLG